MERILQLLVGFVPKVDSGMLVTKLTERGKNQQKIKQTNAVSQELNHIYTQILQITVKQKPSLEMLSGCWS